MPCPHTTKAASSYPLVHTRPVPGARVRRHAEGCSHARAHRRLRSTGLAEQLKAKGVTHVYVCGIALELAVTYTALHAAEAG